MKFAALALLSIIFSFHHTKAKAVFTDTSQALNYLNLNGIFSIDSSIPEAAETYFQEGHVISKEDIDKSKLSCVVYLRFASSRVASIGRISSVYHTEFLPSDSKIFKMRKKFEARIESRYGQSIYCVQDDRSLVMITIPEIVQTFGNKISFDVTFQKDEGDFFKFSNNLTSLKTESSAAWPARSTR